MEENEKGEVQAGWGKEQELGQWGTDARGPGCRGRVKPGWLGREGVF